MNFFEFAWEREQIRFLKEQGTPWPWTDVPELRRGFFCNVFREDDKTTRWFRRNIRNKVMRNCSASLRACVAFRWFNLPSTGERIKRWLIGGWRPDMVLKTLRPLRDRGERIFSGAYIISSPLGDKKLEWAVDRTTDILRQSRDILATNSMESMHARLKECLGLGPFMAYEIVTDLRHTCVGDRFWDVNDWACPGPGAARGLGWVFQNDKDYFPYGTKRADRVMVGLMKDLLLQSRLYAWDRPWEMREVEHTLCEYDKFRRMQAGGSSKRKYVYTAEGS